MILIALAVLLFILNLPVLAIFSLLLLVGVMLFFRDPERIIPRVKNCILATADGKVMKVTRGKNNFLKGPVSKVLIFMSPLDVHRNRAPISGKISGIHYSPGKFAPAYTKGVEELNEKNSVLFVSGQFKVLVTQIAGILARRIVCWVKKGDSVVQGEQFGLIRFGSANEIVFPAAYKPVISAGDKVKAGITIIARKK